MEKQLHLTPFINAHRNGQPTSWRDIGLAATKVLLPYVAMAGILLLQG